MKGEKRREKTMTYAKASDVDQFAVGLATFPRGQSERPERSRPDEGEYRPFGGFMHKFAPVEPRMP